MAVWFDASATRTTKELTANVLFMCKQGNRVQFLTDPGAGLAVVQRMRVALSRSRAKNRTLGRQIDEFTLFHDCYPYTTRDGKRHDCVVMWTEKNFHHRKRELLDDLVERKES